MRSNALTVALTLSDLVDDVPLWTYTGQVPDHFGGIRGWGRRGEACAWPLSERQVFDCVMMCGGRATFGPKT